MKLRNLGIYTLPDGREFIVAAADSSGYSLFSPSGWEVYRMAEYRVGADGCLLSKGIATKWRVAQLADTGRSAKYPQASEIK